MQHFGGPYVRTYVTSDSAKNLKADNLEVENLKAENLSKTSGAQPHILYSGRNSVGFYFHS